MKVFVRVLLLIVAAGAVVYAALMKEKNGIAVILFLGGFSLIAVVLKSFQKGVDAPK